MASEHGIEVFGDQTTSGLRASSVQNPNFPRVGATVSEELAWATDIQSDGADPADGWKRGIGIGGPQA